MHQDSLARMFSSLQALQATMPPEVIRNLSNQSKMLQQLDLRQLSISFEQAQYFAKHSAEIASMHRTYSKLYKIMRPLADKYPQLQEINHAFQERNISSENNESDDDDSSNETQNLYITFRTFVDNILKHGLIQDILLNEATIQGITFAIAHCISKLPPDNLMNWISQFPSILLRWINFMGNPTLSGILNIWTLVDKFLSICAKYGSKGNGGSKHNQS